MVTGLQSTSPDTAAKKAEAHGIQLGLNYRKVSAIPKRTPPAFLVANSLKIDNTKMREARSMALPVVLCRDFMTAHIDQEVLARRCLRSGKKWYLRVVESIAA